MTTGSTFFARSRRNARALIDALHDCLHDYEEYQARGGAAFSDNVDGTEYASYGMTQAEFDYYMAMLAQYKTFKESGESTRENALFSALLLVADAE